MVMIWMQRKMTIPAQARGFHLITSLIEQEIDELGQINIGLLHVFIQHTSASLTINENADPDVQVDLESSINAIAPENFPYIHTMEGPDDMPAHVKASLLGASVSVPIHNGRLLLGTWQGIYLAEHRDRASSRNLILTIQGTTN
jgi:secondary thiamine-phosphate synthase enzyme